ncbi:MAG: septal ring lytic transglycosylase RlpA family protein [Gammaproteobacteria bacterium]|nr:septal ring lytic transglycosylase RlpA family protein [Gammaproteobacteria bacterium]MCP5418467.1 septal ring lytic transglycosylase RlpA family protein [Chromatiaceae bacterium]
MNNTLRIAGVLLMILAVGCSTPPPKTLPEIGDSAPEQRLDPDTIADAVPRIEPRSRYGNPDSYWIFGKRYQVMNDGRGYRETGIASWYGTKFHGRYTSNREPYDMYAMTAAHTSLPLPTYVRVNNLQNGRSIVVRVNDRGPFHDNRIIDLSYAAATKLGILERGTGLVEVIAIDPRQPLPQQLSVVAQQQPPSPVDANPDMFIQVGAFSNRHNADRLRLQLQSKLDRPVRIHAGQHQGQDYFRVQVGPLADIEQSDVVARKLLQLGMNEMHIITD